MGDRWELWVDTGGTFTDCLARPPEGPLRRVKVLSSSALRVRVAERIDDERVRIDGADGLGDGSLDGWRLRDLDGDLDIGLEWFDAADRLLTQAEGGSPKAGAIVELVAPEEAPVLAARLATATPPEGTLPPMTLRLATTLGTNALLERRGARCVLFVTRGFADLLVIGTQQRPDLFALDIERPAPLYERVVEVDERLAADGSVVEPIDLDPLASCLHRLVDVGIDSAAVALMHAHRDRAHERAVAEELRDREIDHVSESAELAAEQGYLARAETAVVDAYVGPVLTGYVDRIRELLGESAILVMTSAGGLVGAEHFRAKDALLSGPAGGVVGAAAAGRRSGRPRLISFDMGGTSTDVARCDGEPSYVFDHRVGDAHLLAPAVAVETVAAGGGSICDFDGQRLTVGPQSGGARPGPACYGAGGPLCLTDVNLLSGRLHPDHFHIPLDRDAARRAFDDLRGRLDAAGEGVDQRGLLDGLRRIADERMAEAIRRISVREGYDPGEHALVAFGGAGPQHACAVAELLQIDAVLVPPAAGMLSAFGLGAAAVERFATRELLVPLAAVADEVEELFAELIDEARGALAAEAIPAERTEVRRRLLFVRLTGQESAVEISFRQGASVEELFVERYRELYGYLPERRELEVVSLRVAVAERRRVPELSGVEPGGGDPRSTGEVETLLDGEWRRVRCYERRDLGRGARLDGPTLVVENHTTTVVEAGWRLEVDDVGTLHLQRRADP